MPCQTFPFASSRIPTELLSAIFDFALPESPRLTTSASLTEAPTVLTHVCARWRTVAYSTPSLWANVSIALYGHARPPKARHPSVKRKKIARMSTGAYPIEPKQMPHDIQLASFIAWLARSKASPLTVALHNVHASHPACAAFLTALCAHAARWRAIDIVGVPLDLFPALPATLPLLETLTINSYGFAAHHNSALAHAFVRAPRLRAVSVRSAALPTWHFPWAQLTALTLVEFDAPCSTGAEAEAEAAPAFDAPGYHAILSACSPALAKLQLTLSCTAPASPVSLAPLTLPGVRTLTLNTYSFRTLAPLLRALVLPALHTLKLYIPSRPAPVCLATLVELLPTGLRVLDISECALAPEDAVALLGALPALEVLDVRWASCVAAALVRALMLEWDAGVCVRGRNLRLREVRVVKARGEVADGDGEYARCLREMIASRWRAGEGEQIGLDVKGEGVARLKSVMLRERDLEGMRADAERWRQEGLVLNTAMNGVQ